MQDIILGCFYYPPMGPISVLDGLQASPCDIQLAYPTANIFLGDFNSPGINWSDAALTESYSNTFQRKAY